MGAIRRPSSRLLLEMAQPTPAREPMELRALAAPHARSPGAQPAETAPGFVRFTINWGHRNGAVPNRVLGHVCRRGQVRSTLLGAIEIGVDESTFDVDARVARRFETLVRRPDKRDPKLRIQRA